MTRAALRRLLGRLPGWTVVGEAADGYEAIRAVNLLQPDLVLMDLAMPRCDGLLATRWIRRRHPEVRVIILTVHRRPEEFWEAIRSGAQGYLVKGLAPEALLASLQELATDRVPISAQTAHTLLHAVGRDDRPLEASSTTQQNAALRRNATVAMAAEPADPNRGSPATDVTVHAATPSRHGGSWARGALTGREWQVAALVARGLTNREIAQQLVLSEHTVHNHVKRILAKTGARNRADLTRRLAEHLVIRTATEPGPRIAWSERPDAPGWDTHPEPRRTVRFR